MTDFTLYCIYVVAFIFVYDCYELLKKNIKKKD